MGKGEGGSWSKKVKGEEGTERNGERGRAMIKKGRGGGGCNEIRAKGRVKE